MTFRMKDFPDHPDRPIYRFRFAPDGSVVREAYSRYELNPHPAGPGKTGTYRIHTGSGIAVKREDVLDRYANGVLYSFDDSRDLFLDRAAEYYAAKSVSARAALESALDGLESVRAARDGAAPQTPDPAVAAIDLRNELLGHWLDAAPGFRDELMLAMQGQAADQRAVDLSDPTARRAYWNGFEKGCCDVLAELFAERSARAAIRDAVRTAGTDPDPTTVLGYLYGHGTARHAEMATDLGVAYGQLTRAMAPHIACGSVQASRTGPGTRYVLTPAGCRFFRDEIENGREDGHA